MKKRYCFRGLILRVDTKIKNDGIERDLIMR